jgi:hypothetical protein
MRQLNAGDLFRAGAMLRKALPRLSKIKFDRGEEEEKAHAVRIGAEVLPILLEECYDDAWAFLAAVNDMTVEQFNTEPMDKPLETIETLIQREDMRGFFKRAAGLIGGKQ